MNVGVYGLGRFGMFWASQLSEHIPIVGYNRSPLASCSPNVILVEKEQLLQCDTIILCVAISSFEEVVSSIAPFVKPHSIIMDTCSVKTYPVHIMKKYFPADIQILATHPMFGPDSGKHGISGLPLVFDPVRLSSEATGYWRSLFMRMNLHVLEMDCDSHDREAAYSQGVTHFVGRVLNELHLSPTQLGTVGYRNLMSIVEHTCNDPLQLFYDLQRYNPYAHHMHLRLKEALDTVLGALDEHDVFFTETV